MKHILLIIFLFNIFSCSQRQSLGTKSHTFGKKGKHIVWIQVPGLSSEHLAIIKLSKETADQKISFENSDCLGSTWGYNLFELRPNPKNGLMSQILGSKNIKGSCGDFDRKAVWTFYHDSGYEVGIIESPSKNNFSLVEFKTCEEELNPLKNTFLWTQNQGKGNFSTFHHQEGTGLNEAGVYYDKSCQEGRCYVSFRTNVEKMWQSFKEKNSKTFFVIRDFSLYEASLKKDVSQIRDSLAEINNIFSFFLKQKEKESILIVLSSSGSIPISLPKEGKQWEAYEKSGRNLFMKEGNILGNVWATGLGAENFCGIYEESEIFKRFLWMSKETFFDLVF